MKDPKKLLIVLLVLLMGAGLTLSILLTNMFLEQKDDETDLKVDVETPIEQEAPEDLTENEEGSSDTALEAEKKEPIKHAVFEEPKVAEKKVATAGEVNNALNAIRQKAREFRFADASQLLYEAVSKYENSGEASILYTLNNDMAIASMLGHVHHEGEKEPDGEVADEQGRASTIGLIQDPEMSLLGTLVIDHKSRGTYILYKESLNPIFTTPRIAVGEIVSNPEGDKMYAEIQKVYKNVQNVTRMEFQLDGHWLYGYVITFKDGKTGLHSIQEVERGSTPYKTVSHWEAVYKALERKDKFDEHNH